MGLVMSKILRLPGLLGQALLRPITQLKATCRRNAIIYANMTPEQLREHIRMRDELREVRERRSELMIRYRTPGGMF